MRVVPPSAQAPLSLRSEPATARFTRWTVVFKWTALGILTAWVVAYLFTAWPAPLYGTFDSPWDSSVFGYGGEIIRRGGVPYVSFWDHKGPLIYLIDAAGLVIGHGQLWGIWLFGLLATLAALGLAYAAMRRACGVVPAVLGSAFFVFALPGVPATNLTEEYALPLQWAAALLLVWWSARPSDDVEADVHDGARRRVSSTRRAGVAGAALGATAGAAFLLRANLIGAPLTAGIVLCGILIMRRQFRGALAGVTWALGGAVLVIAPVLVWIFERGAFGAFWDEVIRYNFLYAGTSWGLRLRAADYGVRAVGTFAPLVLALAGWGVAALRLSRSGVRNGDRPFLLFALSWGPVELALASMSGRDYNHYFVTLLAPAALLVAILTRELLVLGARAVSAGARGAEEGAGKAAPARQVIAVVLVASALAISVPPLVDVARRTRDNGLEQPFAKQITPTASYIRAHTLPGEPVLVWGHGGAVYFAANRPAATPYIYVLPLLTPGYTDAERVRGFIEAVRRANPSLIVDASGGMASIPSLGKWNPDWHYPAGQGTVHYWAMSPSLKGFYDFVACRYAVVDSVGPARWAIYRRRGLPRALPDRPAPTEIKCSN